MRSVGVLVLVILNLTLAAAERSPFVGKWEGKINNLPGVDLTIETTGREISEVMVFFQLRGSDGKWRVKDKHTVGLLAARMEGKILAFEVPPPQNSWKSRARSEH
jgi:hypothetical protein